jgi:hypothetical protein
MLYGSHYHPWRHPATLPRLRISLHPHLGVAQVPDKNEPENEAEQFIEKQWLTEAQKAKLSNLLKTKDRISAGFFIENEPEHFIENKRH